MSKEHVQLRCATFTRIMIRSFMPVGRRKVLSSRALVIPFLAACFAVILLTHVGTSRAAENQGAVKATHGAVIAKALPALPEATVSRINSLVARGHTQGLRRHVFMKVGDSNSWFPTFLQGAGCGPMNIRNHKELRETIGWYRDGRMDPSTTDLPCADGNSFTRDSAATKSCEGSGWLLSDLPTPLRGGLCDTPPPTECAQGETPLACEARILKPSLALVMIGTNDIAGNIAPDRFEANLRKVVRQLTARSIVVALSTIPPRVDGSHNRILGEALNRRIREVAHDARLPLLDLWLAMTQSSGLINGGLFPDGVHLNVLGGWGFGDWAGKSMLLGPTGLKYGANLRNLLTLRMLHRLRLHTVL